MAKPLLILDQHFRKVEELFSKETFAALEGLCRIEGGEDRPMEPARIDAFLDQAAFLVAARPALTRAQIGRAKRLRAIIEVSGAFHDELDYAACFERGLEALSCAPGFRRAVAEMGLAMILAAGRGLVAEHEAFRAGNEHWLDDMDGRDFSLFGQSIGFVGYGNIGQELHRLLQPFDPVVRVFDPWLQHLPKGVRRCELTELFEKSRVVIVTAVPTAENRNLVGATQIGAMQAGSALVLLSRAHVIDFNAALRAAAEARITFATDVYPSEPVGAGDPMRHLSNVICSPHRAAAVPGGRYLIGDMILHDITAILGGDDTRQLLRANPDRVASMIAAQNQIEDDGKLPNT